MFSTAVVLYTKESSLYVLFIVAFRDWKFKSREWHILQRRRIQMHIDST